MITTLQNHPMPMPDGFVDQWHVHPWSHFKEHSWPKQCCTSPDHESESILLMEQIRLTSLRLVPTFYPIIYKVLYIQMGVVWVSKTHGISTDFADWPSPTCLESSKPPKRDMALAKRTTWPAWIPGTADVFGYLLWVWPLPNNQWPTGLWTISSRESQPKPLFATVTGKGPHPNHTT